MVSCRFALFYLLRMCTKKVAIDVGGLFEKV